MLQQEQAKSEHADHLLQKSSKDIEVLGFGQKFNRSACLYDYSPDTHCNKKKILPDSLARPAHCGKIAKEKELTQDHKFKERAYQIAENVGQSSYMGIRRGETVDVIASSLVPVEMDQAAFMSSKFQTAKATAATPA